MKVLTVVGARPQFIKAAPVSKALRAGDHQEFLVHTGQHYDREMSQVFFEELGIPVPDTNLGVGSGSHAQQTGEMLTGIADLIVAERPDWVLVYGDTNSTLAGALAASKLQVPLAHVEAGLRSFNRTMPEEHNRVMTDHCADLLLCPTQRAMNNLAREGITKRTALVGDTMYDALLQFAQIAHERSSILRDLNLNLGEYLVATVHRAYNTDEPEKLIDILNALNEIGEPVVFPMHPRTRSRIAQLNGMFKGERSLENLKIIDPISYLDMLVLQENARVILTDSGGMQKEAYFLGVPCVTLRPETEWLETVETGWNVVAGTDPVEVIAAARRTDWPAARPANLFGSGNAASLIVKELHSRYEGSESARRVQ